jgi:hypothetical protein
VIISWTLEDEAVWDSLVDAGYIKPDDPRSLLSVVNGASRHERARLLKNLHTLPEDEQYALRHIIVWIMSGAPDRDPR